MNKRAEAAFRKLLDEKMARIKRLETEVEELSQARADLFDTRVMLGQAREKSAQLEAKIIEVTHEIAHHAQTERSLHWALNVALGNVRDLQLNLAKSGKTSYAFDDATKTWNIAKKEAAREFMGDSVALATGGERKGRS